MGIFIYLNVSKGVTREKWENVYEETLHLISHLPLAERRKIELHGVETVCLVKTKERQYSFRQNPKEYGWMADGDLEYMKDCECYYLPRNLVSDETFDPDAGDAMRGVLSAYLKGKSFEEYRQNVYNLWDAKTQGEPYHMYLLAIACLIESRLGTGAFVYGDITRGQCRKAVEIANRYLEKPIEMPDRCYADRLARRVSALNLTDEEKLEVFECLYLGTKDADFGEKLRDLYSEKILCTYWENNFKDYEIGTTGFSRKLHEYLLWGFDIGELCRYVNFKDKEELYKKFVACIMDAKLHLKDKNCTDPLKIDQEEEQPYSIWTLFAQFGFAGAENKKVDRYVPIEEIRAALKRGLAGRFDADPVIDKYLEDEASQMKIDLKDKDWTGDKQQKAIDQDKAEVFYQVVEGKRKEIEEQRMKYDISDWDGLIFYEKGDTVHPDIVYSLGHSRKFLDSLRSELQFEELSRGTAAEQFRWLAENNHFLMIKDSDWETVFQNLSESPESFARYYPIMRAKAGSEELVSMLKAFMINDELYSYTTELADNLDESGIKE